MQRSFRTALLIVAVVLGFGAARVSRADNGPPVPEPDELINLVRNTVLAVDHGNKTGDYSKVSALASPAFNAANPPDVLAKQFEKLKAENLDLAPVATMTPLTTGAPTIDRNGLLRILGFFEVANRQLVYDLVCAYQTSERRWGLAGIALKPRLLPEEPELMQPQ